MKRQILQVGLKQQYQAKMYTERIKHQEDFKTTATLLDMNNLWSLWMLL